MFTRLILAAFATLFVLPAPAQAQELLPVQWWQREVIIEPATDPEIVTSLKRSSETAPTMTLDMPGGPIAGCADRAADADPETGLVTLAPVTVTANVTAEEAINFVHFTVKSGSWRKEYKVTAAPYTAEIALPCRPTTSPHGYEVRVVAWDMTNQWAIRLGWVTTTK